MARGWICPDIDDPDPLNPENWQDPDDFRDLHNDDWED